MVGVMKIRIISSILAIPLLIFFVNIGGMPFKLAWFMVIAIALYELFRMQGKPMITLPSLFAFTYLIGAFFLISNSSIVTLSFGEMTAFYIILNLIYFVYNYAHTSLSDVTFLLASTIYVVATSRYFLLLRDMNTAVVYFVFVTAWSYDTFAYLCGVKWGRKHPWPLLSPKKSIEGVIGGIVGCLVCVSLYAWFMKWPVTLTLIYAFFGAILGQTGDLIESAFKRQYGVKDSGYILPGHGGILDRFDGALLVAPLTYYFIYFVNI